MIVARRRALGAPWLGGTTCVRPAGTRTRRREHRDVRRLGDLLTGVGERAYGEHERQGAPQLNSRFERQHKRRMTGYDWGAWVAVRALGQGVLRTRSGRISASSSGNR